MVMITSKEIIEANMKEISMELNELQRRRIEYKSKHPKAGFADGEYVNLLDKIESSRQELLRWKRTRDRYNKKK